MMYAYQQSPNYYLMMEDDVIARKNYVNLMFKVSWANAAEKQKRQGLCWG